MRASERMKSIDLPSSLAAASIRFFGIMAPRFGATSAYMSPSTSITTISSTIVKPAGRRTRAAVTSLLLFRPRGDVVLGALLAVGTPADDLELVPGLAFLDHVVVVPGVLRVGVEVGVALVVWRRQFLDRRQLALAVLDLPHLDRLGDRLAVGFGLLQPRLLQGFDHVLRDDRAEQAEDDDDHHDLNQREAVLVGAGAVAWADWVLVHGTWRCGGSKRSVSLPDPRAPAAPSTPGAPLPSRRRPARLAELARLARQRHGTAAAAAPRWHRCVTRRSRARCRSPSCCCSQWASARRTGRAPRRPVC